MTIEFRCVNCNKLLRVKDESAGKKAKCPECATVLAIPTPGASPEVDDYEVDAPPPPPAPNFTDALAAGGARTKGAANPFQSPQAYDTGLSPAAATGELVPTRLDIGTVLGHAWLAFKEHAGTLLAGMFMMSIIASLVGGLIAFTGIFMSSMLGNLGVIMLLVVALAEFALIMFLQVGLHVLILKAARRQRPEIGDLFQGGPFVLPVLGAAVLFAIAQTIGLILFIIPGIIISLMLSQFLYLIIDRKLGIMDSLSTSKEITHGNKLTLFLLGLIIGVAPFVLMLVFGILGQVSQIFLILLIPVGLIVGILYGPYVQLVMASAYLMMTGQLRQSQ